MWIEAPDEDTAMGPVRELYDHARDKYGFVPDAVKVLTPRPDVAAAVTRLKEVLLGDASSLGSRRADLVAIVVSGLNHCEYCGTAHAGMLAERGDMPRDSVAMLYRNWRDVDLNDDDRVMLEFAEKLTYQPSMVTQNDVDGLRAVGFSDVNVYDLVMLVAYRNFINRVHDGLGAPLGRLQGRFGRPLE